VTDRILLVDDEQKILDGLRRSLHGQYQMDTANSGPEGLKLINLVAVPYAVVVSDMMMPGMNGAQFLAKAHVACPDTVQMVLSGQADLGSTIAAVNEGNLFRFLTKPCESADLTRAIDAALGQYRLINSERELLEHTLNGAVEVLIELMSTGNPVAFARTQKVKATAHLVTQHMGIAEGWELGIAAMLGQVGMMAVPDEVLAEIRQDKAASPEALDVYRSHPALAADLIRRIPRLDTVAEWVGAQPATADQATTPPAGTPAVQTKGGVDDREIYATVMAFVTSVDAGRTAPRVYHDLVGSGVYRRELLDEVLKAVEQATVRRNGMVNGTELIVGMQLGQDVVTLTGLTLVRSGEILTESMAIRLRHFATGVGVVEPINVLI
jgi:CheY-like chemotaxis protein